MKVLLVDDNRDFNELISSFLSKIKGYEVFSALSGDEAIDYLNKYEFDLFIIDIHLPKINGLDLIKIIRDKSLKIPIIMITASEDIDTLVKAFSNGCNEFIKKPFHLKELEVRIDKIMQDVEIFVQIDSDLKFDCQSGNLYRNEDILKLRKKELKILKLLVSKVDKVVTYNDIVKYVWDSEIKENYPIRQLISSLKKSVPELKDKIKSITSKGYIFSLK